METQHVLAVIHSDLQYICALRSELEANGFERMSIARNGEEALLYLRGIGIYANRSKYPLPTAIIVDTENPDGGDLEVLSWCRERAELKELPIVLLCEGCDSASHISCMLDPASLLIKRSNFEDILHALWNVRAVNSRTVRPH